MEWKCHSCFMKHCDLKSLHWFKNFSSILHLSNDYLWQKKKKKKENKKRKQKALLQQTRHRPQYYSEGLAKLYLRWSYCNLMKFFPTYRVWTRRTLNIELLNITFGLETLSEHFQGLAKWEIVHMTFMKGEIYHWFTPCYF